MNERDVERLLTTYGDSLGHCERKPVQKRHFSRVRGLTFLMASAAAVAIVVLALRPTDAVAGTLQRVGLAIKNAKTMERTSWFQIPSGKWNLAGRFFYKNGMWAQEGQSTPSLKGRSVHRDGKELVEYARLSHATIGPDEPGPSPKEMQGEFDALDFVKREVNVGQVSIDRSVRIIESAPVEGRATYTITLERAEDKYRADILVDKETNLPISSQTVVTYERLGTNRYRDEYKFNHDIPDETFALTAGDKPVIDVLEEEKKLGVKWQEPLQKVGASSIRDACVTDDGTIWIATTADFEWNTPVTLPDRLSAKGSGQYILAQDIPPGAILAKAHRATISGEKIIISMYVRVDEGRAVPSTATVSTCKRYLKSAVLQRESEILERSDKQVEFPLRREPGTLPSYFTTLDMDRFGFGVPMIKWNHVASYYEEQEQWAKAAAAYEESAKAHRDFVKYSAHTPMRKAAVCYRKLGQMERATQLEKDADALKASRER